MDLNSQPTASSEWFDPEEAECQWAAVASEADGGQSVTTAELKSSDAVDGGVAYSLELRDYTFANGAWKFEKMDTVPPGDAAETLTALRPAAHRIDPDLLYEARLLHRAGEEPMRPRPLTKAEIRETGGLAQVKALLRPSLLRRGSAIAMERGAGESAAKVAIPGTPVDYPIVQAPADDPTYYLKHDVYRKPNYMGCPYLDADCAEGGLFGSANAVVFGHNLGFGDTSMFNAVASYTDASFAREHRRVLLQTPDERREFEVQAADCIGGWEAQKRTRFESEADFSQWYADRLVESDMRLTDEAVASPIVTLCTCSYNRWADNERTVVYAAPIGAEKSASENPQVDGAL